MNINVLNPYQIIKNLEAENEELKVQIKELQYIVEELSNAKLDRTDN